MNCLDLNKVLGLVEKAAYKGYYDAGTGFIDSEFAPKVIPFINYISKRISGGTMSPEMAVIKAYNFGIDYCLCRSTGQEE
jgi:hypothetical protein